VAKSKPNAKPVATKTPAVQAAGKPKGGGPKSPKGPGKPKGE
jgi:hypothetical protein